MFGEIEPIDEVDEEDIEPFKFIKDLLVTIFEFDCLSKSLLVKFNFECFKNKLDDTSMSKSFLSPVKLDLFKLLVEVKQTFVKFLPFLLFKFRKSPESLEGFGVEER